MKVMKLVLAGLIAISLFLVVLQLSPGLSSRAHGQVVAESGKFLAVTSGRNVLWLIDVPAQRMLIYRFDDRNDRLFKVESVNLQADFRTPVTAPPTTRSTTP